METDFPGAGVPHHSAHDVESPAWGSEDLLVRTRRVWGKVYGREIDRDEAIEILANVRRLAEVLWQAR